MSETVTTPGAEHQDTAALRRQVDMVYAYALRQTGHREMAADITQAVFVVLARKKKSGHSPPERFLHGWLFKVASYAVKEARRAAARRAHHERRAAMESPETATLSEDDKAELVSTVDASLLRLSAIDREVIVRRYLQGQPLADVAAAVGMTENTAGRRVARALEKLRKMLAGRNVRASAAVVAAVVAEQALVHAPRNAVAGVMSTTAAPQVAALSNAVLSGMVMMKTLKVAAVSLAVVGVSTGAWVEIRTWAAAHAEASAATAPAELTVTSVLEENSDTLLQNELALTDKERAKIQTLDVDAKIQRWQWDPAQKRLVESLVIEGRARVEVAPPRRTRLEVSRYREGESKTDANQKPTNEQSFVELWDGVNTRQLQGPPLSTPSATVQWAPQPAQDLLAGSDFSLHLMHDPPVARALVPGPHPLARESFYGYVIQARRVMLQGNREAVEFSMEAPRNDRVRREFWLDPGRGHALMALRRTYSAPDVPRTEVVIVDTLAEAAPGVFFPKKAHSWTWDPQLAQVTSRTVYEVKEVAANKPLPPETFTLDFPAGTPVKEFERPAAAVPASRPAVTAPAAVPGMP